MSKLRRKYALFFWLFALGRATQSGAVSGPGEPTLAGQPIGLLLALTYSATEVE